MRFFSKLFGKSNQKSSSSKIIKLEDAEKIIQKYGNVLENNSPRPGSVSDVCELPYKKEQIKQALIIGLHENNNEMMKEMLKVGYIALSNWQENVGNEHQGLDFSKIDFNDTPRKTIEQFNKQSDISQKWSPLVEAEKNSLEKELRNLGLW